MHLHIKAATLMAVTFVSGCGFVPKKPTQPIQGQRIPINQTAPNPRPWAPPLVAQAPVTDPLPSPLPTQQTTQVLVDTKPEGMATTPKAQDSSVLNTVAAEQIQPVQAKPSAVVIEEPLAMWPVLLAFNPAQRLDNTNNGLAPDKVTFSWPEPVKPALSTSASTSADSATELSQQAPMVVSEKTLVSDHAAASQVTVASEQLSVPDQSIAPEQATALAVDTIQPSTATQPSTDDKPLTDAISTSQVQEEPAVTQAESTVNEQVTTAQQQAVPIRKWSAQAGMTLSELLSNWGADDNWIVRWATGADYRIEAPFSIDAPDFLAAATHIFRAYRDAGRTFNVRAYANQVLVVKNPTD